MDPSNALTFFITVKGNAWVKTYLGVLLQSIDDLYHGTNKVVINYTDLSDAEIEKARRKLPYVRWRKSKFEDLPESGQYSNLMDYWFEYIEDTSDERIVFLDADMAILKDISHFFEKTFDVAYTYYENHITPYGDAGRTKSGYIRLNSGIVLVKNREKAKVFFHHWKNTTNQIIATRSNDLVGEWGSADQAALAHVLDTDDHSTAISRHGVLLLGIPCSFLNETECRPITDDTHVIHYKAGWRPVLPDGTFNRVLPQLKRVRNEELCGEQFQIWKNFHKRWLKR